MDISAVLTIILLLVFSVVGVALVMLFLELIKMIKSARQTFDDLGPTLKNVETMVDDIAPATKKIDPMMDRLTLTVDTINLEMMRVDKILEDVSEITGAASSATAAVDNITSAPLRAVNNAADRVKVALGGKSASAEAEQLAEQRVAVAQALKEYEAAESVKKVAPPEPQPQPEFEPNFDFAQAGAAEEPVKEAAAKEVAEENDAPKSYVEIHEGEELVIDPQVIAESPFFNGEQDEE